MRPGCYLWWLDSQASEAAPGSDLVFGFQAKFGFEHCDGFLILQGFFGPPLCTAHKVRRAVRMLKTKYGLQFCQRDTGPLSTKVAGPCMEKLLTL